jgi:hypothetical protein
LAPLVHYRISYLLKYASVIIGLQQPSSVKISGPLLPYFQNPFPFIHFGEHVTLTGFVLVGEEHWENGVWTINEVTFGDESFVGNLGCMAAGNVPNNSIVASLAVVDGPHGECNSLAFGNPAIWTKYGSDRSSLTFTVAAKDYNRCLRVVAETFILLVLRICIAMGLFVGSGVGYMCYLYNFDWMSIMLLYRATGVVYVLVAGLLVKVLFIG